MEAEKWISVKKRLPCDYVDVLITDGIDVGIGDYQRSRRGEDKWATRGLNYIPVTHWMPLPSPPKQ